MKKLVGLVVIIAVLVLVSYYGMGVVTERTVKHNITEMNKANGLKVDIAEYKRGWFSSTALLNGQIHIPERVVKADNNQTQIVPAEDYQLQIPLKIYHGPIIYANHRVQFGLGYATTDLALPPKYSAKFNERFTPESTQPRLNLSLFINYLNNSRIKLSLPTFKLIAKQGGGQFDWHGLTSLTNVTSDAKKIEGNVVVDSFQINKNDTTAVVSTITADYDMHKTDIGLYLGDANLVLPSLVVSTPTQKLFELDDLEFHSKSDINDGLFNSYFKSSVAKVFVTNQTYGPGKLDVAIKNLDAEVLNRINQQAKVAQQGTDAEKQQAMFAIIPEIPKLFSRGAEFDITELSFVMPQGTITGNLVVSLPKSNITNPFELVQKVQGRGQLSIPSEVFKLILNELNKQKLRSQNSSAQPAQLSVVPTTEQIDGMTNAQINAMLQSGLFVAQDKNYVINMTLDKGQLQINGKPFNPAMVKF